MSNYQKFCAKNPDYQIKTINDAAFAKYGKIWNNFVLDDVLTIMNKKEIPFNSNIYITNDDELNDLKVISQIKNDIFAGIDIQTGPCMGHNNSFSAIEYHNGSEVNIACTDIIMVLGQRQDLEQHHNFDPHTQADIFYIPKNTVFEMYNTTLHYSPIEITPDGFKVVVILPLGTNEELSVSFQSNNPYIVKQNKFQVVHPSRIDKISQGIQIGLVGDLLRLNQI